MIQVYSGGKQVGVMQMVSGGWQYCKNGGKGGKVYRTLELCKRATIKRLA
jgi:hypothetical protein